MTKFKGTPLFGQDSSPQNTSEILALIGTCIFWLIFLVCMIFIKPKQKEPEFKEVQIVLSSTPVKKQEEAPAPAAAAPAESAASEPVVQEVQSVPEPAPVVQQQEPVAPPKPKAEPKPEPKAETPKVQKEAAKPKAEPVKQKTEPVQKKTEPKKAPAPAPVAVPVEPIEYAVDPMEAFDQQIAKKPKQEFNWDMFDDEPAETSSSVSETKTVKNTEPAFSGSAASAAESTTQKVTSSSSSNSAANKSAKTSTSNALAKISNTSFTGRAANGVSMETTAKTATSGSGKVMMEMSNGSSRALLEPEKPIINLSEAAAATIDGSRTVKIRLKVVESGNVPYGDVTITPESILAEIVRKEIKDQISKWRFEADDYTAFAEFEYKIVKQ